jgi:hypothetical protein
VGRHSSVAASLGASIEGELSDEGLSQDEEVTCVKLIHEYERSLLIRSQAVKLLRDRGHDISGLLENPRA